MDIAIRTPRRFDLAHWLKLLAIAFILALLVSVFGCAQMPSGLELSVGLTGSPLGIAIGLKTPPTIIASGPDGFAVGTPTTNHAAAGDAGSAATAPAGNSGPPALPAPEAPPK